MRLALVGKAKRSRLGEYFDLQRGTTYKSKLLGQPGPVLLGLASIQRNGGFRRDSLQTYGGDSPAKLLVHPGELYLSLKDVTQAADLLGAVARLPAGHPVGRLTQDTVKLEPKGSVPLDYLYWLLQTPQYRSYCRERATGTTNLGLSRDDFLAFPAPEPNATQSKVVEILSLLEKRIDLTRRMNEILHHVARTWFKSWFVDFDPVRSNTRSRGIDWTRTVKALFPTTLQDSELGAIPDGWEVKPFANTVDIVGGGTPKTSVSEYWDGDIPWFAIADSPRNADIWVIKTENSITQAGMANSSAQILPIGTTILTARGTVGRLALVGTPMAINQSCYGLRPKLGQRGSFTYFLTQELISRLQQRAHGSVFDTITRETLAGLRVPVPPASLIESYESRVQPLMDRMKTGLVESESLRSLRNTLLPHLVSSGSEPEKDSVTRVEIPDTI